MSAKNFPALQPSTPLAAQEHDAFNATGNLSKTASAPAGGGKLSIQDQPSPEFKGSYGGANYPGAATAATPARDTGSVAHQMVVDQLNPVMVIHADISADAARRGDFDQLLTKNAIVLTEDQKQKSAVTLRRKQSQAESLGLVTGNEGTLDVVYVEAAPAQIQNTLADLRKAPQTYSAVTVSNLDQSQAAKDYGRRSFPPEGSQCLWLVK